MGHKLGFVLEVSELVAWWALAVEELVLVGVGEGREGGVEVGEGSEWHDILYRRTTIIL